MMLSPQEESLIQAIRALPPEEGAKILHWAEQLAALARGRNIEWSDTWSDEDLRDAVAASIERFEEQELENR